MRDLSELSTPTYDHQFPPLEEGPYAGTLRVLRVSCAMNCRREPYTRVVLRHPRGNLLGLCWPGRCRDPFMVRPPGLVRVQGVVRHLDRAWVMDIEHAAAANAGIESVCALPAGTCPQPALLERLEHVADAIGAAALRQFVSQALASERLVRAYVQAPASRSFHHCDPGGLLAHCVECAETLLKCDIVAGTERDLGIVALLFHDIGKAVTLADDATPATRYGVLQHDELTLELLAGPLARLDAVWPDGAALLRHLLVWRPNGRNQGRPHHPLALLVRFIDNYSAKAWAYDDAFATAEDWQRFAWSGPKGAAQRWYRPRAARAAA